MYDNHIFCEDYEDLKNYIIDIFNGDAIDYDIEDLSNHVQELYDNSKISGSQYDDLMNYIQDLNL